MIQDGLSAHWTPNIERWAGKNRVTLVPTATNASWMNPVECHTGDIQKLALDGSDFRSWDEFGKSFENAVDYRTSSAKPEEKGSEMVRKTAEGDSDDLCGRGARISA